MKLRLAALLFATLNVTLCFAADPNLGTWKLNETQPKIESGFPRTTTVVYEAAGDHVKATFDGIGYDGEATHGQWLGKFDGKDYPVVGDHYADMRSMKQIDDHTMELTITKGGKVTLSGLVVVAGDGKTRTLTTNGIDAEGRKVQRIFVYDKQ
jgi:hypothetical protein